MRALLRAGAGDEQLETRLAAIWGARSDRYSELRAASEGAAAEATPAGAPSPRQARPRSERRPRVEMSYIGG